MRNIEQRKRNKYDRPTKKKIVFALEGNNETEKNYLEHFRKRGAPYTIEFTTDICTDPVNMVNSLKKYKRNKGISTTNGDRLFCLVDGDLSVRVQKQPKIYEAQRIAKENDIDLIISIPSFEYWLLLHFKMTTRKFNTYTELERELKKYISNYDKNMDVYKSCKEISGNMQLAIDNAKKVEGRKETTDYLNIEDNNPYTAAYKVIEIIQENITQKST